MSSANLQRFYRAAKFYLMLGLTLAACTTPTIVNARAVVVVAPPPPPTTRNHQRTPIATSTATTWANANSNAKTLQYYNKPPNADGDFHYEFQTSNGITTKGRGNRHGHTGVLQYISLEGVPVTMTYVADANGYHPTGAHIPKTPEQVLQSLSSRSGSGSGSGAGQRQHAWKL